MINNIIEEFRPTYLCIKQHSITGKLYLCKTTHRHIRMLSYKGSGRYWNRHLKKHGKQVETPWYCLFTEKDELVKFALMLSEQMNIVNAKDINGKKIWANEKLENGLDGALSGSKHSDKTCTKISKSRKGQPGHTAWNKGKPAWNKGIIGVIKDSDETKLKKSLVRMGDKNPMFGRKFPGRSAGDKNPMFGKTGEKSPTYGITRVKIECPYCLRLIAQGNYSRWHGENCKLKIKGE